MVDYSKWDQLGVSDDDEERPGKPRVQRFDGPRTVTICGKDASIAVCPSSEKAREDGQPDEDEPMEVADEDLDEGDPLDDHREDVLQCRALGERALRRGDTAEGVRLLEKAWRLGGDKCPGLVDLLESARRRAALAASAAPASQQREHPRANGGIVGDRYAWSQTQDSLQVDTFVPESTAAKDVRVDVSETSLDIYVRGVSVLAGEWEHKVAPEEDPDWEMKSCDGRRSIQLTVKKAEVPLTAGLVIWWKRVLKGEPAISLEDIKDRKTDKAESFARVWEEAHAKFREKVKERKPIVVGAGETEEAGDAIMET